MFVFCGRLANFRKQIGDDLYKSLNHLFEFLATHWKNKHKIWQIFTILFSLVAIENL
jgi:hypothetical protein